jgi:hypothetical protein
MEGSSERAQLIHLLALCTLLQEALEQLEGGLTSEELVSALDETCRLAHEQLAEIQGPAASLPIIDPTAARDQTKAHIEGARRHTVDSSIRLILAQDRLDRGGAHVQASIDRLAHSRVKLTLAHRMLAAHPAGSRT